MQCSTPVSHVKVRQLVIMGLPEYERICQVTSLRLLMEVEGEYVILQGFDIFTGDVFEDTVPSNESVSVLTPFVEHKCLTHINHNIRTAMVFDWPNQMVSIKSDVCIPGGIGSGISPALSGMGRIWTFHNGQKIISRIFPSEFSVF